MAVKKLYWMVKKWFYYKTFDLPIFDGKLKPEREWAFPRIVYKTEDFEEIKSFSFIKKLKPIGSYQVLPNRDPEGIGRPRTLHSFELINGKIRFIIKDKIKVDEKKFHTL